MLAEVGEKRTLRAEGRRRRKATIAHPEIYLQYGEQLRLGLHLPPRHSDPLQQLADTYFDPRGVWNGGDRYDQFIEQVEEVPEQVTIFSDAMKFMEREIERRDMARRERELLAELDEKDLYTYAVVRHLYYP